MTPLALARRGRGGRRGHVAHEKTALFTVDLIRSRGHWLVADIHSPETPSFLRLCDARFGAKRPSSGNPADHGSAAGSAPLEMS